MARPLGFDRSVFINCPFDSAYAPLFEAMVFAVIACGCQPISALAEIDSGTVRIDKIRRLIRGCRLAIHDLSRVELSGSSPRTAGARALLPRFNMPYELGLDVGCRYYGTGRVKRKKLLVLDARRHRYHRFISDASGQDILCHGNSPPRLIARVREYLRVNVSRLDVPGELFIMRSFQGFGEKLPEFCRLRGLNRKNLLYVDYVKMAKDWVEADRKLSKR
jgi:hypothetical protein